MTKVSLGDLYDMLAITKGGLRGSRRPAVLWMTHSFIYCPSVATTALERVEVIWKSRARGRHGAFTANEEDRPEQQDVAVWLGKLDPQARPLRLPMTALHEVEYRRRARITLHAAGRSFAIRCGTAYEAEREFDILLHDATGYLSPVEAPARGWRAAHMLLFLGLALLGAGLLLDLAWVAGGTPPATLTDDVRRLFAQTHTRPAYLWTLRGVAATGLLLTFGALMSLRRKDAGRYLVLADSSTPMTMERAN